MISEFPTDESVKEVLDNLDTQHTYDVVLTVSRVDYFDVFTLSWSDWPQDREQPPGTQFMVPVPHEEIVRRTAEAGYEQTLPEFYRKSAKHRRLLGTSK